MKINDYLDSTYLKTPEQSGLSEEQTLQKVWSLTREAIDNQVFAVMIRPEYVRKIKEFVEENHARVKVGTVIGFHEGSTPTEKKLAEARNAIEDGADELDFVINFEVYKAGAIDYVRDEFLNCTKAALDEGKTLKWIIEIAALSDPQIADLTQKLSDWAHNYFKNDLDRIFVKSSTGFYKTQDGRPNGATVHGIEIMLRHAGGLPVKAAGGVRTAAEAREMISLGVKRIGTSAALALISE